MFVVPPFSRTERRHEVALKEYPVTTDTELWRAAVVGAVTDATGQLVSANVITQGEFDRKRLGAFAAQRACDDAALMRYLTHYCPDDPHIEGYPGPDERTTMRA